MIDIIAEKRIPLLFTYTQQITKLLKYKQYETIAKTPDGDKVLVDYSPSQSGNPAMATLTFTDLGRVNDEDRPLYTYNIEEVKLYLFNYDSPLLPAEVKSTWRNYKPQLPTSKDFKRLSKEEIEEKNDFIAKNHLDFINLNMYGFVETITEENNPY